MVSFSIWYCTIHILPAFSNNLNSVVKTIDVVSTYLIGLSAGGDSSAALDGKTIFVKVERSSVIVLSYRNRKRRCFWFTLSAEMTRRRTRDVSLSYLIWYYSLFTLFPVLCLVHSIQNRRCARIKYLGPQYQLHPSTRMCPAKESSF